VSATALRAPARPAVVARHYLALLGRETAPGAIGLAVALSFWGSVNRRDLFEGTVELLPLMMFLPMFQWRGGGRDHAAALPLGGVRHDLVRVACGTAWAAATLGVPVALQAVLARGGLGAWLGGYPWWYPLPLLAAGLAFYLLGSAVWLRTPRPGRVLLVLFFFANGLREALGLGEPGWAVVYGSPDELRGVGAPEGIAAALAWLGAGCAAVGLSAAVGGRAPRAERGRDPSRIVRWPARRGAARRGPRPVPARPPRPASALTALRAQAALMRHRMVWPAAIAVLLAWKGARAEIRLPAGGVQGPLFLHDGEAFLGLALFAFFWPLLVWMDERGPGREHAEALPVGVLTLRLARVAAGGAALAALCVVVVAGSAGGAWIAGTLPSPAAVPARVWAGVPAGALMMYLAGSLPLLLSADRPLRRTVAWCFVTLSLVLPYVWSSGARDARFSPTAALSVFTDRPVPWTDAALLWLAVLAAAAAYAAALGAFNDRGGPWSPADAGRAA
jgi:hypothetical protein